MESNWPRLSPTHNPPPPATTLHHRCIVPCRQHPPPTPGRGHKIVTSVSCYTTFVRATTSCHPASLPRHHPPNMATGSTEQASEPSLKGEPDLGVKLPQIDSSLPELPPPGPSCRSRRLLAPPPPMEHPASRHPSEE